MFWADEITLMRDMPKKVHGVQEHHYTASRKIFGEKKSVKWAEFFAAAGTGLTLTAIFVVRAEEYSGESVLEWNGRRYAVQRAYETGETVELTCSDLSQDQEDGL
nr:MAG TPA: head closure knob [Caudoviricetes sp.]